jgi:Ran GTPase-activating protein (RanGAP) involved in mRNA processing and transport
MSLGDHRQSELALGKLRNLLTQAQDMPVLNLADAFIGDEGCDMVAQFLRDNPTTTTVELRGNNIGPQGASYIAQALVGVSSVRNLSLEWNVVSNGLGPLTEALSLNANLESLDLRNNRIGPEGAGQIARMLQTNKGLNKLDLRWNEIGSSGANEILQALKSNKTLKSIDMSGNKVPESIMT